VLQIAVQKIAVQGVAVQPRNSSAENSEVRPVREIVVLGIIDAAKAMLENLKNSGATGAKNHQCARNK
jgi:hypothetical protein